MFGNQCVQLSTVQLSSSMMTLLPPTASQLLSIKRELNPDPVAITQGMIELKLWLRKQPHLPDIEDEEFLHRFLHGCQYDLKITKEVMNLYFMMRGSESELFFNRDPTTSAMRHNAAAVYLCQLPSLTPDGFRVIMIKFAFPEDPASADIPTMIRRVFMMLDISLMEDVNNLGIAHVFDMQGFSFRHLKAFTLSLIKKSAICLQDALPAKVRHGHMLNSPAFASKLLAICKPFLRAEIFNQIVVHESGYDGFYKYVPRDMLPAEYGGKAGTHKELSDAWQTKLETYKDWFLKEEAKRKREVKRNPEARSLVGLTLGMEGPFSNLGFD